MRVCSRCLYDTTIPGIEFDEKGVCQFCRVHDHLEKIYPLGKTAEKKVKKLIDSIKKSGRGKKYNCVVGVSGGTDSTFTLLRAKALGLRPLAVHFDNGWNSEIAVRNIYNAITKLKVDLETVVADWEEFKDLQISFLKASVSDAEIPTDVAIHAVLHSVAAKENIKYILLGHSFRTEGLIPITWTYMDWKYLESVQKKFGKKKITSIPSLTIFDVLYYQFFKGIHVIPLLNYFDYSKEKARKILEKRLEWEYYGGHHHESLYTKFFQSYLLPKKFNIDKRKLSLSARVRSGDISRDKAIEEIEKSEYEYDDGIVNYTLTKLGLTQKDFNKVMTSKRKTFRNYGTYYPLIKLMKFPLTIGYQLKLIPDIIYFKYIAQKT